MKKLAILLFIIIMFTGCGDKKPTLLEQIEKDSEVTKTTAQEQTTKVETTTQTTITESKPTEEKTPIASDFEKLDENIRDFKTIYNATDLAQSILFYSQHRELFTDEEKVKYVGDFVAEIKPVLSSLPSTVSQDDELIEDGKFVSVTFPNDVIPEKMKSALSIAASISIDNTSELPDGYETTYKYIIVCDDIELSTKLEKLEIDAVSNKIYSSLFLNNVNVVYTDIEGVMEEKKKINYLCIQVESIQDIEAFANTELTNANFIFLPEIAFKSN